MFFQFQDTLERRVCVDMSCIIVFDYYQSMLRIHLKSKFARTPRELLSSAWAIKRVVRAQCGLRFWQLWLATQLLVAGDSADLWGTASALPGGANMCEQALAHTIQYNLADLANRLIGPP